MVVLVDPDVLLRVDPIPDNAHVDSECPFCALNRVRTVLNTRDAQRARWSNCKPGEDSDGPALAVTFERMTCPTCLRNSNLRMVHAVEARAPVQWLP